MSAVTFILDNLTDSSARAPLYCMYPGQCQPQPARVYLDEDGEVTADYKAETGVVTMREWNNRLLSWPVSPFAKGTALAALLQEDPAHELLEAIHAGHTVAWDGSNHRGYLSDEAQAASDLLGQLLADLFDGEPSNVVAVWSMPEWLFSCSGLFSRWSGRPLAEVAAGLEAEIEREREDNMVTGDVAATLLDEVQRLFDEDGGDGLDAHHVAALLADGRITPDQAANHPAAQGGAA